MLGGLSSPTAAWGALGPPGAPLVDADILCGVAGEAGAGAGCSLSESRIRVCSRVLSTLPLQTVTA